MAYNPANLAFYGLSPVDSRAHVWEYSTTDTMAEVMTVHDLDPTSGTVNQASYFFGEDRIRMLDSIAVNASDGKVLLRVGGYDRDPVDPTKLHWYTALVVYVSAWS